MPSLGDQMLCGTDTTFREIVHVSLGGGTVRMVMVVDDPDQMFERAVAAGATVVWPVEDKEYGWRVGRVADPYGHHWEIGKPLKW